MKKTIALMLILSLFLGNVLPVYAEGTYNEGIIEPPFITEDKVIPIIAQMNLIDFKKIGWPVIEPTKFYNLFYKDKSVQTMNGAGIIYFLVRKFYPGKIIEDLDKKIFYIVEPLGPGDYFYYEMPIHVQEDMPGDADEKAVINMLHQKKAFITYQLFNEAQKEVLTQIEKEKKQQLAVKKSKTKKTISKKKKAGKKTVKTKAKKKK